MREMSVGEIAAVINAQVRSSGSIPTVYGVSTDSRTVKDGDCFLAIAGEKFDGHDYVEDVLARGAACAVVSRNTGIKPGSGKVILKVKDTIRALGDLARHYRETCGYRVVAITGSVGKTTTRQIVSHVLGQRFKVHQSPKSFNNNIGVPLTLLGAEVDTEIVVAELGTNHPGEIEYLTRIALPDIAVVTNVHPAHLEGFGSVEAIAEEKMSISAGLHSKGVLLVNGGFPALVGRCRGKKRVKTFGRTEGCDYLIERALCEGVAIRFEIAGREVCLGLPGMGNVDNAGAAWAICSELGMEVEEVAKALETMRAVSMRAEMLKIGTLTVLNDCYNANPASMRNALDILRNIEGEGRRVFICGDMAELGAQSEHLHAELGEEIAGAGVGLVVSVGRLAGLAGEQAKRVSRASGRSIRTESFENAEQACDKVDDLIENYDIILVKGSRLAGLERIVERLQEQFSQCAAG